jgi:hypothetical protein
MSDHDILSGPWGELLKAGRPVVSVEGVDDADAYFEARRLARIDGYVAEIARQLPGLVRRARGGDHDPEAFLWRYSMLLTVAADDASEGLRRVCAAVARDARAPSEDEGTPDA